MGRVREGSFNLVFNQATLLPDAERGVAKSFPYPARHRLTLPLLSLSLPSSAHARKRRGKVVNARHGGRRRTALFLDFIQGEYILLPFAPKDSAPTSRVHLVGGTSCLSNFFPPSSFSSHGFFQRERTSLSPRKLDEQDIFNQGREDEAKIIYGYRRS